MGGRYGDLRCWVVLALLELVAGRVWCREKVRQLRLTLVGELLLGPVFGVGVSGFFYRPGHLQYALGKTGCQPFFGPEPLAMVCCVLFWSVKQFDSDSIAGVQFCELFGANIEV